MVVEGDLFGEGGGGFGIGMEGYGVERMCLMVVLCTL